MRLKTLLFTLFSFTTLACEKTINVSVGASYPPFSYKTADGTYDGIDILYVGKVLKKAGFCSSFLAMPSTMRTIRMMKQNVVDMTFGASYTDERSEFAFFSIPYREEKSVLFTRNEMDNVGVNSISDAVSFEHIVSINKGAYFGEEVEKLRGTKQAFLVEINDLSQRFNLLDRGRVDYVLEDLVTGNAIIEKNKYKNIVETNVLVYSTNLHFMLNRQTITPQEVIKINRAINYFK